MFDKHTVFYSIKTYREKCHDLIHKLFFCGITSLPVKQVSLFWEVQSQSGSRYISVYQTLTFVVFEFLFVCFLGQFSGCVVRVFGFERIILKDDSILMKLAARQSVEMT